MNIYLYYLFPMFYFLCFCQHHPYPQSAAENPRWQRHNSPLLFETHIITLFLSTTKKGRKAPGIYFVVVFVTQSLRRNFVSIHPLGKAHSPEVIPPPLE